MHIKPNSLQIRNRHPAALLYYITDYNILQLAATETLHFEPEKTTCLNVQTQQFLILCRLMKF